MTDKRYGTKSRRRVSVDLIPYICNLMSYSEIDAEGSANTHCADFLHKHMDLLTLGIQEHPDRLHQFPEMNGHVGLVPTPPEAMVEAILCP